MEYYANRILFFRRAGILFAFLILYDMYMLQFGGLSHKQIREYVQKGTVMSITFGIINIWHDYLFFSFALYARNNPTSPKNRE